MEETLASQKMAKIDLINSLEKISSEIPNRILKLEGFLQKENQKEQLEIIIFRGYSSSTTHPIEIDSEKKIIPLSYTITNFKLYKAPLTGTKENFIKENQIYVQAGAGIVADSKPLSEFKETENKALAILTACKYADNLK